MLQTISDYISCHGLLAPHSRVLVGLSGGADSVCLTRVLLDLGHEVVAAHCNFHLRGEESMRDERFVVELCARWGIECVTTDFDTAAFASAHGLSIEMAARELRYAFFRDTAKDKGCDAIAVGHHRDDSIETLLLNLVRGTGLKGLCGIQPKSGDVVRPLLCVSRSDIDRYLAGIGQGYVTDHTNREDEYARNKMRLNVLPEFERINQGAKGNIATTMANMAEAWKVYSAALDEAVGRCTATAADGAMCIDKQRLMAEVSPISVLHQLLSPLGFNRSQMADMLRAMGECGRRFVSPDGATLLIDRKLMIVEQHTADHAGKAIDLAACHSIGTESVPAAGLVIDKDAGFAYIDADKVHTHLTVRHPRQGDTFAPFGMKGRRKLLSDYLTDQKLSVFDKARQLLVCDGGEIVWVVGRRSSELYRVDDDTRRVIILKEIK